ncbi:thioredoxin family protein [Sphingobacterium sp. E70]|uniref:thioredoxin family protein n=1 Tax=Sphingobacterium sp. E70 TaxID=2853439 RepID=UPI00211CBADB|nr:thioredoxin fold domain-containing protein [Sphingobacterium sp. E70]ULT26284.1 thioredoxin family protein [Sphingobacterium sp. E70]
MKKLLLTSLAFIQSVILLAQEHIQFQKVTFSEAKELAKKENKLIFLDGFTSWCAPCKWMEGNVFSQPEVADYFNSKFINTKFDCEVGEGVDIAKNYQIKSFPTYLFLDGQGTLIYRTQSRMEADLFLKQAQQANDSNYQIPNLRKQYDQEFVNLTFCCAI